MSKRTPDEYHRQYDLMGQTHIAELMCEVMDKLHKARFEADMGVLRLKGKEDAVHWGDIRDILGRAIDVLEELEPIAREWAEKVDEQTQITLESIVKSMHQHQRDSRRN